MKSVLKLILMSFLLLLTWGSETYPYITDASYNRLRIILDNNNELREIGYSSTGNYLKKNKLSLDKVLNLLSNSKCDLVLDQCEIVGGGDFKANIQDPVYNDTGQIIINNRLILIDCKLDRFYLNGLEFKERIYIEHCNFGTSNMIKINNCHFEKGLYVTLSDVDIANFINSRFDYGFFFQDNEVKTEINIVNCLFVNDLPSKVIDKIYIPDISSIIIYDILKSSFWLENPPTFNPYILTITSSKFNAKNPKNLFFLSSNLSELKLINDTINIHTFFATTRVRDIFNVESCIFNHKVSFENFMPHPVLSYIDWNLISGFKLSLFREKHADPETGSKGKEGEKKSLGVFPLDGRSIDNYKDYKTLMQNYNLFRSIYSARWDQESENKCYIEMKTIETLWLKREYIAHPSLRKFLNWQLNIFLKNFCEFGTDPVKSIYISLYVVLAFAGFYFFFPHEWDLFSRRELATRLRILISRFTGSDALATDQQNSRSKLKDHFKDFKEYYDSKREEVPFFVRVMSRSLIWTFGYAGNYVERRLWSMKYIQPGWKELTPLKRFSINFLITLNLIIYLVFALMVRLVNSITLSINAFSTLGFGSIPTKGLSRYLAVVEGFTGWFLLTIFSVSLIAQLLK